ncbi:MAG: hypothetical protein OEQ53_14215, partial [Saprospiraceae bacterium]|nr:hypothetical protein [Saprospiraceae bacterium]
MSHRLKYLKMALFIYATWALPYSIFGQTTEQLTDEEILSLYDELRVADVSDGMDMVGLRDIGLIDPSVQALWKDMDDFSHQFRGIAVTVRYIP